MRDTFDPYREWLGLDAVGAPFTYYHLLGVERDAASEHIKRAADYAINRVRSVRPGKHAAAWARLIDELRAAQTVLTDPERRAAYDLKLASLEAKGTSTPSQALKSNTQRSPAQREGAAAPEMIAWNGSEDDLSFAYPPTFHPATVQPVAHHAGRPFSGASPVEAPGGLHDADPMAPVVMPESGPAPQGHVGAGGFAAAPAAYYYPPGAQAPAVGPGGIPYARPVEAPIVAPAPATTAPLANAAAVGSAHAATPAMAALPAEAPVEVNLPAPPRPRRRGSYLRSLLVGVAAVVMLGGVLAVLKVVLNSPASERVGEPAGQGGGVALGVGGAKPQVEEQVGRSFVPPAKTDLPPLPERGTPLVNAAPAPEMKSSASSIDPASSPRPELQSPEPKQPTEAEKAQTAQAIQAMLAALREQNFDAADSLAAQVETVPKTPNDEQKIRGVKALLQGARTFAGAVQEGFQNLQPEKQISFSTTTVKVVEASPESVSIEVVPGMVREFTPDKLPLGLKYGLVNAVVPPDDPANALAKAAYHVTQPGGDAAEARYFLEEAKALGAEVDGALWALDEIAGAAPPTAEELEQLTRLAQAARAALTDRDLEKADEALAQAEKLARLDEHKHRIAALKQLAHYTREFWRAVDESLKDLTAVGELTVGETVASVVESRPNHLIVRVEGRNRRYTRRDMPGGLAMAAAEQWLDENNPASRAATGAHYAVEKKGDPDRARQLWQEASRMGLDTAALLETLDEDYDFTK